jgi:quercetin dioxygenase-like cupin family protein
VTTLAQETALLSLVETIAAMRAEADGAGNLAVVECTLRRGQMPPLHSHDTDEVFYVLEGTLVIHCGGEPARLEAGDAFVAPRDVAHTHEAESDGVRYLSMAFTRSVARYEDFLRAVAVPGPMNGDEMGALASIARANGIAVLGHPGALPAA